MARREFDTEAPYQALSFTLQRHGELLPPSGRILLLHPRAHSTLSVFPPDRCDCITPEKLDCERLGKRGYQILDAPKPGERYALAVVFPGESKDEALYLLALGASLVQPGAMVLATMSNDLGASRFESKLGELLGGEIETQSKNKCRVFWGTTSDANPELIEAWIAGGKPRKIEGAGLWSLPGLFSWNKIDKGTGSLAPLLPETLKGKGADLGCGYGFLAKAVLERCGGVTALALYDSDRRAIEMAKLNIGQRPEVKYLWHDIQSDMPKEEFDFVVMNPPFHEYGRLNVELGKRFFRTAHEMLRRGGSLYAVVNRHLPYDEALWGIFPKLTELANKDGYRVLKVDKGS